MVVEESIRARHGFDGTGERAMAFEELSWDGEYG